MPDASFQLWLWNPFMEIHCESDWICGISIERELKSIMWYDYTAIDPESVDGNLWFGNYASVFFI